MRRSLFLALVLVATACSSGEAIPEAPAEPSVPQSTPATVDAPTGLPPVDIVARWLEFVQERDIDAAAALFEASPVAAEVGYESPREVSAFYGLLGWLNALQECTEERLAPAVVALNCTFSPTSELHDALGVEMEELRFIFEGGIPTEVAVARSGSLVHHELQLYAQENDGTAFADSCSKAGQSGRFWYDGICAEYLAAISPAARDAVGTDS